jgi:predicted nucleic acid-binding protein
VIVVSDASPLIILAATGDLALLELLFGQLQVPQAVVAEVTGEADRVGAAAVQEALDAGWLVPAAEAPDRRDELAAAHGIGSGEAAAMVVAQDIDDAVLLLDDRKARRVAADLGLRRVGTIRVLELAHENGHLPELGAAYRRLLDSPGRFTLSLLNASLARYEFEPISLD